MDIISSKKVKTRKPHNCFGCGRKFEKGSYLGRIVSADGGDIQAVYECETCDKYSFKFLESGDLYGYGELRTEDKEGWEEIRKEVEGACTTTQPSEE